MKMIKNITAALLTVSVLGAPFVGLAADQAQDKPTKARPYTLKTCPVSGDELGAMGKAYTFEYQGREIKLCCKSCLKDFNKNPAKYVKKIDQDEAKAKKAKS